MSIIMNKIVKGIKNMQINYEVKFVIIFQLYNYKNCKFVTSSQMFLNEQKKRCHEKSNKIKRQYT